MTRRERRILAEAANILTVELASGREVYVPGFGRFRLSDLRVSFDFGRPVTHIIRVAKFKPFRRLKLAIRRERQI